MTSIWHQTVQIAPRPALEQDLTVDAAVIGAGLTGVLTGYFLAGQGLKTVILERGRIGCGQTGRTTAKITSQQGLIYQTLIRRFGAGTAKKFAQSQQEAVALYQQLIQRLHIDCDFEPASAYLYGSGNAALLKSEAEAAASLGLPASFCGPGALHLPFETDGAVRFDRQAQFHPLKFLDALSRELCIFENTPVTKVRGGKLLAGGHTVCARAVVFAAHYPLWNLPGLYFTRLSQQRAYCLALENAPLPPGMFLDVKQDGLSLRRHGAWTILSGMDHTTGENPRGGRYDTLRQTARRLFGQCREIACWSAQDAMSPDLMPYAGRYSAAAPQWYVASGFDKWGMTRAMWAARQISGMICGQNTNGLPVRRINLATAGAVLKNGVQSVKGLTRVYFAAAPQLAQLPRGHGGIFTLDGRKTGAYRDDQGRLMLVDPRCTHLGCLLTWNPDERSWDCPCHGSRFDPSGAVLDSPAILALKRREAPAQKP